MRSYRGVIISAFMYILFFPFLTAFALTACHLVGTVSSWVLPYHPTNNTWDHISPLHHWDSRSCCRNVASRHLLIPNITWTTAIEQILQVPKRDNMPDTRLQKKNRTCSVWTWWKNCKVWGCTEWLQGDWEMQSNRHGPISPEVLAKPIYCSDCSELQGERIRNCESHLLSCLLS